MELELNRGQPAAVAIRLPDIDGLRHRAADRERTERLLSGSLGALLTIVAQDPNLRHEGTRLMDRAMDFRGGEEGKTSLHRRHTALLAGIALGDTTKNLLTLAIRDHLQEERLALRKLIWEQRALRVGVLVAGGGPSTSNYLTPRFLLDPNNPALVVCDKPELGGPFGASATPVFPMNHRNRGQGKKFGAPGRKGSLDDLGPAPMQAADISNLQYATNWDTATATALNILLSSRVLTNAEVIAVMRNPKRSGLGEGRYLAELEDKVSGRRLFVTCDREVSLTGTGTFKWGVDSSDADTAKIIEKQERLLRKGRHPKVMNFEQLTRMLGDPNNPTPLAGIRRVVVYGDGDSAKSAIGMLAASRGQIKYSSATLDSPREILWLGTRERFAEAFLKDGRCIYSGVALELPRNSGSYFHRVLPVAGRARQFRITRSGDIVLQTNSNWGFVRDDRKAILEEGKIKRGGALLELGADLFVDCSGLKSKPKLPFALAGGRPATRGELADFRKGKKAFRKNTVLFTKDGSVIKILNISSKRGAKVEITKNGKRPTTMRIDEKPKSATRKLCREGVTAAVVPKRADWVRVTNRRYGDIAKKIKGEQIYRAGTAAKLRVSDKVTRRSRSSTGGENRVARFTVAPLVEELALKHGTGPSADRSSRSELRNVMAPAKKEFIKRDAEEREIRFKTDIPKGRHFDLVAPRSAVQLAAAKHLRQLRFEDAKVSTQIVISAEFGDQKVRLKAEAPKGTTDSVAALCSDPIFLSAIEQFATESSVREVEITIPVGGAPKRRDRRLDFGAIAIRSRSNPAAKSLLKD